MIKYGFIIYQVLLWEHDTLGYPSGPAGEWKDCYILVNVDGHLKMVMVTNMVMVMNMQYGKDDGDEEDDNDKKEWKDCCCLNISLFTWGWKLYLAIIKLVLLFFQLVFKT